MGDGWTLTVDLTGDGYVWGVRATDWDEEEAHEAPFRRGKASDLDTAKRQAEASHQAGPAVQ